MAKAIIFPGQGSQTVGMGKALYETYPCARHIFEEVDSTLNYNLSRLMFEGPEEELRLTKNTQPALMATSLAVLSVLKKEGKWQPEEQVKFVAGHSLGEYSALASVKSFSLADTTKLLRIRGKAMQEAAGENPGSMAAVLGLDLQTVHNIVKKSSEKGTCVIANDNCQGQVVISGSKNAVEYAIKLAKEQRAKRCVLLPVSAPFHCPLMKPAAEKMKEALSEVDCSAPLIPLISNITAAPVDTSTEIKDLLIQQVCGMVRWRESVEYMAKTGITTFIEVGSGQVLSGLVRRISPEAKRYSLSTPKDIETFLNEEA